MKIESSHKFMDKRMLWQLGGSCFIGHQQHSCLSSISLASIITKMVETREKTQLDKIINCPMTTSFPQDKGQIEVRKLVKTLNKLDALKQEETSVEVNEECDSLRYKLRKLLCASGNKEESN